MVLPFGQYLGLQKSERNLESYKLTLHQYDGNAELPMHCHEFPYLSMLMGGVYQESTAYGTVSEQLTVDNKVLLLRPSGYQHSNRFDKKGGCCFNIEFKNWGNIAEQYGMAEDVTLYPNNLETTKVVNGFVNGYDDDVMSLLLEEVILVADRCDKALKRSNVVKRAIERIEEDYGNSFSLTSLSEFLGVHPVYLARKFKAEMNQTIGEYLLSVRLRKAFCLLNDPIKKLTNTAYESGFYDQSHFSRNFKKAYSESPKKIKQKVLRLI